VRILIAIGVPRQKEAGAAGVALNNATELVKRGHQVDCWFLEDALARPVKWKRFESLLFAFALTKKILHDRVKFDVVNLHAPWGCAYGMLHRIFRPKNSPPYVMTMQGSEERYVQAMTLEHRKGRAWQFGWKNRVWHRIYHQTMYHLSIFSADYGTVANREGAALADARSRSPSGRISYVPNGVEERFFIGHEYVDKTPLRLLFVGTWLDRKGIYYLADAFNSLARLHPAVDLTVAGCLSPAEDVKKFFAPEVRNRVHVVQFVSRDEMPSLYAAHDIFVFPSLVEGMPLTLLEAMAAGMPVVASDTCGMTDLVEDGLNGLLVPPANAEALVNATERLCQSVELRKQLGKNAQQSARQFTWEKVTEQLERVLTLAANEAEAERSNGRYTSRAPGDRS
jgi:glycosyltransferase involved in cell wall biosynthesis